MYLFTLMSNPSNFIETPTGFGGCRTHHYGFEKNWSEPGVW